MSIDNPWCTLHDLCCRKDLFVDETLDNGIAYLEEFRRVLPCYPAILLMAWLDVVIPA